MPRDLVLPLAGFWPAYQWLAGALPLCRSFDRKVFRQSQGAPSNHVHWYCQAVLQPLAGQALGKLGRRLWLVTTSRDSEFYLMSSLSAPAVCVQAVICVDTAERHAHASLCGGACQVRAASCAHKQRGLLVR